MQKRNRGRRFEDLKTHQQMASIDKFNEEIVRGKLKIGQLMRNTRRQNWQKLKKEDWDQMLTLHRGQILKLKDEQLHFIRDKLVACDDEVDSLDVSA